MPLPLTRTFPGRCTLSREGRGESGPLPGQPPRVVVGEVQGAPMCLESEGLADLVLIDSSVHQHDQSADPVEQAIVMRREQKGGSLSLVQPSHEVDQVET